MNVNGCMCEESWNKKVENLNSKFDIEFYNGGVYQDDSYYDIKNLLIEDLYHYSKKDKNCLLILKPKTNQFFSLNEISIDEEGFENSPTLG